MTTKLRNSERQKSQVTLSWLVLVTRISSKMIATYFPGQPRRSRICRGSSRKRIVSYYLSCHAHHVDSKLTTSQETDSKPKMWRCPPPPIRVSHYLSYHAHHVDSKLTTSQACQK